MEETRPGHRWVVGFEGFYSVNRTGVVVSYMGPAPRELKSQINRGGYVRYALYRDGKRVNRRAHTLVLDAFLHVAPAGLECNHIDGDKLNNSLENLEWVTKPRQIQHAYEIGRMRQDGEHNGRARLTESDVRMIRYLAEKGYEQSLLEFVFGLKPKGAWPIVHHRSWKKVGPLTDEAEALEAKDRVAAWVEAQKSEKT